ncbi:MAG: apolipoprotein N-acyltransferase [Planctomycetes bacterium]|nr:apolipoprotein N-acyltransferase [Planctomycetota bacterium]
MRHRLKTNLILAAATVLSLTIAFPPIDLSPSAYVCLVPWLVLIRREKQRTVLWASWLIGLLFFFINVSWLRYVTYPAWFALALYLSLFFPVFGVTTRFMVRRSCLPLTVAAPVAWVGQEYLRSFMLTGFPWFFLGHTQYRNLIAIQLADLTGVYGISFILVTVNACIADVLVLAERRRNRARIASLIAWTALLLVLSTGYGIFRLAQDSPRSGPRVCVVQGNIPQSLKMRVDLESFRKTLRAYRDISLQAEGQEMDLVVWPETMVPGFFNLAEILDRVREGDFAAIARESLETMQLLSRRLGAPLLVGGETYEKRGGEFVSYNSAFYFDARHFEKEGRFAGRYDKIHLVPFGEYVPLKRPLPFLKGVLSRLAGYIPDFTAGEEAKVFDVKGCKFGVLICYEDTIAPLVRRFRYRNGARAADFLLNISNDGWFCGSAEVDQHLAICVFRAVENHVGIARSVNTGISGFIAPNGRIEAVVTKDGKRKQVTGALVRAIKIDRRLTFYTVYGELFAWICLGAWVGIIGYCALSQRRRRLNEFGGP